MLYTINICVFTQGLVCAEEILEAEVPMRQPEAVTLAVRIVVVLV